MARLRETFKKRAEGVWVLVKDDMVFLKRESQGDVNKPLNMKCNAISVCHRKCILYRGRIVNDILYILFIYQKSVGPGISNHT